MKMVVYFVCDVCGKESRDHDEIDLCEAQHKGLTNLEDAHAHHSLKGLVVYYHKMYFTTFHPKYKDAYESAKERLIKFEEEHNMTVKTEFKEGVLLAEHDSLYLGLLDKGCINKEDIES